MGRSHDNSANLVMSETDELNLIIQFLGGIKQDTVLSKNCILTHLARWTPSKELGAKPLFFRLTKYNTLHLF